MLPLLKGMLDCFLSVAFCMICWRHVESSVGGVETMRGYEALQNVLLPCRISDPCPLHYLFVYNPLADLQKSEEDWHSFKPKERPPGVLSARSRMTAGHQWLPRRERSPVPTRGGQVQELRAAAPTSRRLTPAP